MIPVVTDLGSLTSQNTTVEVVNSRPDLSQMLKAVLGSTSSGGVGVGSCGPIPLVEQVENLARKVDKAEKARVGGVEVHVERFSL